jgi:Kef-type K+ transport system membrane component KefB
LPLRRRWARQPLTLAYIAAGVIVGNTEGLGWVRTHDIELISELGLILLLFMIGLEIDVKKLRHAGKAVIAAGIGQFAICVALGLGFGKFIGLGSGRFDTVTSRCAALCPAPMTVVKLLYDKFELDTIPGRVTLGVLIFQDIWAILFLALQPTLNHPQALPMLLFLVKGVGLVAFTFLAARYALPVIFRSIARAPEAMLITALAWCFGVSEPEYFPRRLCWKSNYKKRTASQCLDACHRSEAASMSFRWKES